jgi:hypothetical protein
MKFHSFASLVCMVAALSGCWPQWGEFITPTVGDERFVKDLRVLAIRQEPIELLAPFPFAVPSSLRGPNTDAVVAPVSWQVSAWVCDPRGGSARLRMGVCMSNVVFDEDIGTTTGSNCEGLRFVVDEDIEFDASQPLGCNVVERTIELSEEQVVGLLRSINRGVPEITGTNGTTLNTPTLGFGTIPMRVVVDVVSNTGSEAERATANMGLRLDPQAAWAADFGDHLDSILAMDGLTNCGPDATCGQPPGMEPTCGDGYVDGDEDCDTDEDDGDCYCEDCFLQSRSGEYNCTGNFFNEAPPPTCLVAATALEQPVWTDLSEVADPFGGTSIPDAITEPGSTLTLPARVSYYRVNIIETAPAQTFVSDFGFAFGAGVQPLCGTPRQPSMRVYLRDKVANPQPLGSYDSGFEGGDINLNNGGLGIIEFELVPLQANAETDMLIVASDGYNGVDVGTLTLRTTDLPPPRPQ